MNRFLRRFLGCAAAFWLTAALVSCSPEENVPAESTAASADTTISASPAESQTEAPAALPLTLQKSCSHPASHTVYPGESITYTYTLTSTGDAPITDISESCGFSTPSYFSELFLRSEGITPREYRKKMRSIII